MTNISKIKIPKDEYYKLNREFAKTIAELNETSAFHFLSELLTYSERVMLIKRFSAIVMLNRGYSAYRIWTSLKISPTTANKLLLDFENGKFDKLLGSIPKTSERNLWQFIQLLIAAQANPRARAKLYQTVLKQ